MEHRDPVLRQELVQQAAAHVADHPKGVHHRCHGGRQHGVNGKQQRRDKQEGELQRLGDPDQHRGEAGRDQQPRHLDAVFRRGGERRSPAQCPTETKHFRVTVGANPPSGKRVFSGSVLWLNSCRCCAQ